MISLELKHAEIKSFGKLCDRSFDFSGGINVVCGDNESGKSTLFAFIKYIFWGLDSKERGLYLNFDNGYIAGSLDFCDEGNNIKIIRRSAPSKDTNNGDGAYSETLQVINVDTNELIKMKNPGEHYFGIGEELFYKTACVGQLGTSELSGKSINEAIENIALSASEDTNVKRAKNKLDAARKVLKLKKGVGGAIPETEAQRQTLLEELTFAEEKNVERQTVESRLCKLQKTKDANDGVIEKISLILDIAEKKRELEQQKKKCEYEKGLNEAKAEYQTAVSEITKDGFMPDAEYIKSLAEKKRDYENASRNYDEIRKEYSSAKDEYDADKENFAQKYGAFGKSENVDYDGIAREESKSKVFLGTVIGFAILTAIMLCLSIVFVPSFVKFRMPIVICLAISALALFVSAIFFIRAKAKIKDTLGGFDAKNSEQLKDTAQKMAAAKSNLEIKKRNADRLSERAEEKRQLLEDLRVDIRVALAKWGVRENITPTVIEETYKRAETLNSRVYDAAAKIDKYNTALSGIPQKSDLTPEQLEKIIAEGEEKLDSEYKGSSDAELKAKLAVYVGENEKINAEINECNSSLAVLNAVAKSPAEISESIYRTDKKLADYTMKLDAIAIADDAIEKAGINLRKNISPMLLEKSGEYLSSLTDGKYAVLSLGEDGTILYKDGAFDGMRSIEYLSAGTKDSVYISLRMALIDVLYQKSKPMLMFDESFARMDEKRLSYMLLLLDKIKDKKQSFVFTCHKRESEICKERIGGCEIIDMTE